MTQAPPLELARQGNPKAIAYLINRSLHARGIKASTELKDGYLEVILEAVETPHPSIAELIRKGITNMAIEGVEVIVVYGRKAGEYFAQWSQEFVLKPRPPVQPAPPGRASNISARTFPGAGSGDDEIKLFVVTRNRTIPVDLAQTIGMLGCLLLALGVFCPIVSVPVVGTVNYFMNGKGDGIFLLILAFASLILLIRQAYKWIWVSGGASLAFVIFGAVNLFYRLDQAKSEMESSLSGNPFRGIADMALASIHIQWGWVPLLLGASMIVASAYFKGQRPDRQVYIITGSTIAAILALMILVPTLDAYGPQIPGTSFGNRVNRARESEGQQNVRSMVRAQQAFYIENSKFADTVSELGLGIQERATNYDYDVALSTPDQVMVTGKAKNGGIRSFTGAVFLGKSSIGEDTTLAIVCQTNGASQSIPAFPKLEGTTPKCASGSSESKLP